jgi:hypothetical protein
MPTPQRPDPDRDWPSCDDQPGVSIRPLSQADLAALLAHRWPGWLGCWPPPAWPGGCGSRSRSTRWPGGAARSGSGAPPASWLCLSGTAGRSCMTWPSPARGRTSTTW